MKRLGERLGKLACGLLVGSLACAPAPVVPDAPVVAVDVELPQGQPVAPPEPEPEPAKRFDEVGVAASYFDAAPTRFGRLSHYGPIFARDPEVDATRLNPGKKERVEVRSQWLKPMAVFEARSTSLRIRVQNRRLTMVVYAMRDDFHDVPAQTTLVSASRTSSHEGPDGVYVRAGTVVDGETRGQHRRVQLDEWDIRYDGWIGLDQVDQVYEPDERPQTRSSAVAPHTRIQRADGSVIATTGTRRIFVKVLAEDQARKRIQFIGEHMEIQGWVDAGQVISPNGGFGIGHGRGGGTGWGTSARKLFLHRGDLLHAEPHAEAIARIERRRVRTIDHGAAEGGHRVRFPLDGWSWMTLWVSGDDIAFGQKWEAAYQRQVTIEPIPMTATLPQPLESEWDDIEKCVPTARAAGLTQLTQLALTWRSGASVKVPRGKLPAELHACLQRALDELNIYGQPPKLPVSFRVVIDPTPLPKR